MKKITKIIAVALSCSAIACSAAAFSGCSTTVDITVSGSSSVTPLMEILAAVYEAQTGKAVSVNQSDSGTGISETISGAVDIGMASRDIKDSELEQGITSVTIAKDGIALIVNENCSISSVTYAEVTALYSSGTAIDGVITAAITREDGSGTRDAFEEKFDIERYASGIDEQSSTGAVITRIAQDTTGALIGYISLGSLSSAQEQGCKALAIEYDDGSVVYPSVENVQNGTYDCWRNFNLAYNPDAVSDDAMDFIDWINGYVGQAVVQYEGYVPVWYTFAETEELKSEA